MLRFRFPVELSLEVARLSGRLKRGLLLVRAATLPPFFADDQERRSGHIVDLGHILADITKFLRVIVGDRLLQSVDHPLLHRGVNFCIDMGVAFTLNALKVSAQIFASGTRSLSPVKSARLLISLLRVHISRNPLSQIESTRNPFFRPSPRTSSTNLSSLVTRSKCAWSLNRNGRRKIPDFGM